MRSSPLEKRLDKALPWHYHAAPPLLYHPGGSHGQEPRTLCPLGGSQDHEPRTLCRYGGSQDQEPRTLCRLGGSQDLELRTLQAALPLQATIPSLPHPLWGLLRHCPVLLLVQLLLHWGQREPQSQVRVFEGVWWRELEEGGRPMLPAGQGPGACGREKGQAINDYMVTLVLLKRAISGRGGGGAG